MPSTPIYGFPFPTLDDQPGATLHGGTSGTEPILAEKVEGELERVDQSLSTVQTDVARGWRPIGHNDEPGGVFNIDLTAGGKFPAGTFTIIKVYLRGDLSEFGTRLNVRVNNDSTAGLHRRAYEVRRLDNQAIIESGSDAVTSWPVAYWGTATNSIAEMTMWPCDGSRRVTMKAWSVRTSGISSNRERLESQGDLEEARLVSSLQVFPLVGDIVQCSWWAEGWRP